MKSFNKATAVVVAALFVSVAVPWPAAAQDKKSGVVNSRDQILGVTTNQQTQTQKVIEPLASEKSNPGNPGQPCNSKNNPKCSNATKSKLGE